MFFFILECYLDGVWYIYGLIKGIPLDRLIINGYGFFDWLDYVVKYGWVNFGVICNYMVVSCYIMKYVIKDMICNVLNYGGYMYYVL